MFEFDTVSASSYDPSALASKLTQKSAEGWEVVNIVPTGGDVTAFVRRASGAAAAEAPVVEAPVVETPAEPVVEAAPEAASPIWSAADDTAVVAAAAYSPSYETTTTYTPEPAAAYTPQVEEPAGWGATPESTWSPAAAEPAAAEPVAAEPVAEAAPEQPAYQAAAPAQQVPSVPAGWYADPAGRFELRYWDGGQWTEHVARGGAQYTDPPVA